MVERIDEITEFLENGTPNPLHEVMDVAKRDALAADMEACGWAGSPIVVDGDNALTGSHRIAAAELCKTEGINVPIPCVEVADLCALYGLDWATKVTEWEEALPGPFARPWYEAAAEVKRLLPAEVVEYLGYDVDGA